MMNVPDLPWYRQVTREQWKAFFATFLGWLLDGFDFTILTFILIDIQNSFTVDRALAGARCVGGRLLVRWPDIVSVRDPIFCLAPT